MFKISISNEEIEKMPMVSFSGTIEVIDSYGPAYKAAVKYLRNQRLIGFDTETRPVFSPGQKHNGVALLQLSGAEKAFLFRVQSLGMRKELCDILASTEALKIGAASHDDVRGLQKYAKFEEHGFVDLQRIGWQWGIRDKSVKKMAAIILGIRISKTQQLSNWEAEKLSESQQKYAATDAWVCREMYLKLLASEKHPLSKEQLNPQPQPQPQSQDQPKPDAQPASQPASQPQPAPAIGENVQPAKQ